MEEIDLIEFLKQNKGKWFTSKELSILTNKSYTSICSEVKSLAKFDLIKSKYITKEYIYKTDVRVVGFKEK